MIVWFSLEITEESHLLSQWTRLCTVPLLLLLHLYLLVIHSCLHVYSLSTVQLHYTQCMQNFHKCFPIILQNSWKFRYIDKNNYRYMSNIGLFLLWSPNSVVLSTAKISLSIHTLLGGPFEPKRGQQSVFCQLLSVASAIMSSSRMTDWSRLPWSLEALH